MVGTDGLSDINGARASIMGCYMDFTLSHKGQQWGGEFHTPKHVCDLIARLIVGNMESVTSRRPNQGRHPKPAEVERMNVSLDQQEFMF
jgi:hypothetical protein